MIQKQMVYVGKLKKLKGKTAIVIRESIHSPLVRAQFDDLMLPKNVTHGWSIFAATDFEEVKP